MTNVKTPSDTPIETPSPMNFAAQEDGELPMSAAYSVCSAKAARNITRLAARPMSYAFAADGNYFDFEEGFFDIGNWTSSFFTGMSLLDFEITGDTSIIREVSLLGDCYREKVEKRAADTMHDLGFLYTLYSVALYKLTGHLEDRRTALKAADELAKRFRPNGGYIQAWGRVDDESSEFAGLAIIDCMMNLPLLFWAAEQTGNNFYRQIAISHADVTLRHFVREDDSVYHAFRFSPKTGEPIGGDNYCGYGVESFWARGTAWAIYGFALAYRYTQMRRYIDGAIRLANRFLAQVNRSDVPVWDFSLPKSAPRLKDTSAAAIAVCGMQELAESSPEQTQFAQYADTQLHVLCSEYMNGDFACPGVLKDGQVGDGKVPGKNLYRAKNVYTSWGDYFLMEALARNLYGVKGFW